jgi:hypothetical protein
VEPFEQEWISARSDDRNLEGTSGPPPEVTIKGNHRYAEDLLTRLPVDLLVVEQGHQHLPPRDFTVPGWEEIIDNADEQAKVVVESWKDHVHLWTRGPTCKGVIQRWKERGGYLTRIKLIQATRVGGAIHQTQLLVFRIQFAHQDKWIWPNEDCYEGDRPMSNLLLTPPGLVPRSHYREPNGTEPRADQDPMPEQVGKWIITERGARRLLREEVAKGLGLTNEWELPTASLKGSVLEHTTSVYHWEYLS